MAVDHPRSRGVYVNYGLVDGAGRGSSPLARGLLADRASFGASGGIIPARAGFTSLGAAPTRWATDHPRSRGVYSTSSKPSETSAGSSPLARGLPVHGPAVGVPGGIIPARAGFTTTSRCATGLSSDHPRSRGVYASWPSARCTSPGSSPLARGLQPQRHLVRVRTGIIPARAGFTACPTVAPTPVADHPRSRGVYSRTRATPKTPLGSSPLARGLPAEQGQGNGRDGIIPARAGFTHPDQLGLGPVRDHPRSRGVYGRSPLTSHAVHGSSPLARGLRHPGPVPRVLLRIIPARAGFTAIIMEIIGTYRGRLFWVCLGSFPGGDIMMAHPRGVSWA